MKREMKKQSVDNRWGVLTYGSESV